MTYAPADPQPTTELQWHLLNDHRNEAASGLTDAEAVRQHLDEHHGPGGIRNHVEPLELHPWEVTCDPGGSLRLASDVPRCEAECVAHRAHLWDGTPVRGAGESSPRAEALNLLAELREALVRRGPYYARPDRERHNAEYVEKIRTIERLLGGAG